MNIKEHIEAGHYPKDEKGRALVPMQDGNRATICATDAPGTCCILGFAPTWQIAWRPDGTPEPRSGAYSGGGLLPPRPRKVKVTRWGLVASSGMWSSLTYDTEPMARAAYRDKCWRAVELTGEYEEPWS